jgi:HTH-type transcriptional regulator/antitoxin HigA
MTIHRPLRTKADYDAATAEMDRLWGAEVGTVDGDHLDLILLLIGDYEAKHYAIELPDPIEAIVERMEDLGLTRADLGAMLGASSGRVSEILNRRRALNIDMIRKLVARLGLSERCLLQEYPLVAVAA